MPNVAAPADGSSTVEVKLAGPFHKYVYGVEPPAGVEVKLSVVPSHTGFGVAFAEIVGVAFTVTTTVAEEIHPPSSATVTV
jgi:hypothetical protein